MMLDGGFARLARGFTRHLRDAFLEPSLDIAARARVYSERLDELLGRRQLDALAFRFRPHEPEVDELIHVVVYPVANQVEHLALQDWLIVGDKRCRLEDILRYLQIRKPAGLLREILLDLHVVARAHLGDFNRPLGFVVLIHELLQCGPYGSRIQPRSGLEVRDCHWLRGREKFGPDDPFAVHLTTGTSSLLSLTRADASSSCAMSQGTLTSRKISPKGIFSCHTG